MLNWIHAQWEVFAGLGIFIAFIPGIAVVNAVFKLLPRKGFLPMVSTLGLRFFIGMMALIFINMFSLLLIPSFPLSVTFAVSVLVLILIMIWG
jgi:predicted small integral membrane protein